ncbi:hypothetical protein [uncultured Oceanicoccus sp.]
MIDHLDKTTAGNTTQVKAKRFPHRKLAGMLMLVVLAIVVVNAVNFGK